MNTRVKVETKDEITRIKELQKEIEQLKAATKKRSGCHGIRFILGADVGYAIGVGKDGGFYYRPIFGYNIADSMQLSLSYRGISTDGLSLDAVTVGVNYSFSYRKD